MSGAAQKINGSLNTSVERHPALVVAFISFLIILAGTLTSVSVRIGYSHIMRGFDRMDARIERNDLANGKQHREMDRRLDDHGERISHLEGKE